jgi:competence protein ComEC
MRNCWTILALLTLTTVARAGATDKKLDVYWIDTEGGAATLFVTPAGESVLIDSGFPGKFGEPQPRDPTRVHKVATELAGLKKIDFLVTTHYHLDHFGGAAELSKLIPIGAVYDNGDFGGREKPPKDYLEFKADKRVVYNPGDTLPIKNLDDPKAPKLSFRCICTRKQPIPPPTDQKPANVQNPRRKAEDLTDNANSIVQVVQFGDWRMFVGGDVTWNIEEKLVVPVNLIGTIDLYQVTHHGTDSSNNPLVLQACKPTVAVFNNGPTKGCGPESFATIKATESIIGIYQVHKNVRPNEEKVNVPDEFIANKEKDCQGHHIHCAVEADGKAYTLKVPATKHEQRFETKAK